MSCVCGHGFGAATACGFCIAVSICSEIYQPQWMFILPPMCSFNLLPKACGRVVMIPASEAEGLGFDTQIFPTGESASFFLDLLGLACAINNTGDSPEKRPSHNKLPTAVTKIVRQALCKPFCHYALYLYWDDPLHKIGCEWAPVLSLSSTSSPIYTLV